MNQLKTFLTQYQDLLQEHGEMEEAYKWKAFDHFQQHWNLDAEAFDRMFLESFKYVGNLLYQNSWGFISKAVTHFPEETRVWFRKLYDEELPLEQRMGDFKKEAKALIPRLLASTGKQKLNSQQDERTLSVYLSFRFPEKHFLYKPKYYLQLCKTLGATPESPGKRYFHYLKMAEEVKRNHITSDKDLIALHKEIFPHTSWDDTNLITQNFLYVSFAKSKEEEAEGSGNYWIFQCNPEVYDLEGALKAGAVSSWRVAAHKERIAIGDKVIVWQTGPRAGCMALGKIEAQPGTIEETEEEKRFYKNGNEPAAEQRVRMKILHDLSKDPVLWSEIKELPEFENFKAGNQGTNFTATQDQFDILLELGTAGRKSYYQEIKRSLDPEKVEQFLGILRNYFSTFDLDPYDERITLNTVPTSKRLSFIIGSRYGLMIQKRKGKTHFSFISRERVSERSGVFTHKSGQVEAYWNDVDDLREYENAIEEGLTAELERGYKSPYRRLLDEEFLKDVMNHSGKKNKPMKTDLNKILYGPPGTGKTYHSKELAVHIANPKFIPEGSSEEEKRVSINKEYKKLFDLGQIVFTTFHQSFSYEDFIEGIKPLPPKADGEVGYEVQNGIFKTLCGRAMEEKESFNFEDAYTHFIEEVTEKGNILLKTPVQKKPFKVHINSNGTSVATPKTEKATEMGVTMAMLREYIVNGKIRDWKPYTTAIGNYVKEHYGVRVEEVNNKNRNFVMIIDEINRGNVSSILGELITLLEPDKRLGREECLEVELPYSKKPFAVPENVFVIGTMNTADRSVEALDTALRRRFTFEELMPKPQLLEHLSFDGFDLKELLGCINERIEALLDRDHCIGHSYFIQLQSGDTEALKSVFENKIIPLLQEYFYHDYEKIALILGPGFIQRKEASVKFAKFDKIEFPEILPSFELKALYSETIEEAIAQLLNKA